MRTVLLLAAFAAASVSAQPSGWLPLPTDEASVSLVASRPFFDGEAVAVYSSAWTLSTVQPVTDRIRIVAEVPFAVAGRDVAAADISEPSERQSAAVLGNIGLGVEIATRPGLALGAGVRIPTATETSFTREDAARSLALSMGTFSETGRYGAFFPNATTVYGIATLTRHTTGPVSIRAHLAPFVILPSTDGNETEGYVSYAVQALYPAGNVRLGGGLVGTTRTSTRGVGDGFDERSEIALGVLAEANLGAVRPSVTVHRPVFGVFDDGIDLVVGLGVTASFQ